MAKRTVRLLVLLTHKEKRELIRMAHDRGVPVSVVVREALRKLKEASS